MRRCDLYPRWFRSVFDQNGYALTCRGNNETLRYEIVSSARDADAGVDEGVGAFFSPRRFSFRLVRPSQVSDFNNGVIKRVRVYDYFGARRVFEFIKSDYRGFVFVLTIFQTVESFAVEMV